MFWNKLIVEPLTLVHHHHHIATVGLFFAYDYNCYYYFIIILIITEFLFVKEVIEYVYHPQQRRFAGVYYDNGVEFWRPKNESR